ncbi:hypothetical protein ACFQV4_06530 [Streptomyces thermocarboxydus]
MSRTWSEDRLLSADPVPGPRPSSYGRPLPLLSPTEGPLHASACFSQPAPTGGAPRTSFAARAAVLVVTAAAGGAALALAPSGATSWTLAVVLAGWACVAVTVLVDHRLVRKARSTAAERESETSRLRAESARRSAEISTSPAPPCPPWPNGSARARAPPTCWPPCPRPPTRSSPASPTPSPSPSRRTCGA